MLQLDQDVWCNCAQNKRKNIISQTLTFCSLPRFSRPDFFFHTPTAHASASWYSPNWLYRTQITLNHNQVASSTATLNTNFPVLISTTTTALEYTGFADGHVASTTGNLISWVKLPSLSTSTDTVLYMYYGNAAATDQSTTTGVWDDGWSNCFRKMVTDKQFLS